MHKTVHFWNPYDKTTIWHYFQRNLSMFQFLTHVELSRSMAVILATNIRGIFNIKNIFLTEVVLIQRIAPTTTWFLIVCTLQVPAKVMKVMRSFPKRQVSPIWWQKCQTIFLMYFHFLDSTVNFSMHQIAIRTINFWSKAQQLTLLQIIQFFAGFSGIS